MHVCPRPSAYPSAVDSKVNGERKLDGNLAKWEQAYREPTVGNAVEVVIGHGLDVLGGMAVGEGLDAALGGDATSVPTSRRCLARAQVKLRTNQPPTCHS